MNQRDLGRSWYTPLLLGLLGLAPLWAQPRIYVVNNLGTLGGTAQSYANSINNAGQVAGSSDMPGDQTYHAFRTAPNSAINPATDDLGTLGGSYSDATGINSSGQVVGGAYLPGDTVGHAFRTAANAPINPVADDLGTLGGRGSGADAINDLGQVTGSSEYSPGNFNFHAFRTAPNAPINPATDDLGTLGGTITQGFGINSLGQAVGIASLAGDQVFHAFRTAPNAPINPLTDDIGTFDSGATTGFDINASGQVVGQSYNADFTVDRAFRTAPNTAINLATDNLGQLGGTTAGAKALNNSGDTVGTAFLSGNDFQTAHGFIYTNGGLYDLNRLIIPGSGWLVDAASDINDVGQVVGSGAHAGQGRDRAVRLDPLPVMGILVNPGTPRPASLNIDSEGALPVAILGSVSLNVTAIDPASAMFGPKGARNIRTPVLQDVNKDGKLDLVLYFAPDDSGINCTDKIAALVASTFSQQMFAGVEVINTTHTFPCPR
jgi:probable HAF family extracellular repeat protein